MIVAHKTSDQNLINSMDTIARYLLGDAKIEEIEAKNKQKADSILGLLYCHLLKRYGRGIT